MILSHTIDVEDTVIQAAYSDIVMVASNAPNNVVVLPDFKYGVRVYVFSSDDQNSSFNSGPKAILKSPILSDRKAIFRIEDAIQDFTKTDAEGYAQESTDGTLVTSTKNDLDMFSDNHSIHVIDKYSRNKQNLVHVFVLPFYEYRETSTSDLTTVNVLGQLKNFFCFNSVTQHNIKKRGGTFLFEDYILNGDVDKFLTKFDDNTTFAKAQKIRSNDYHTIGFINGFYKRNNNNFDIGSYGSRIDYIRIQCFQADGSASNQFNVTNNDANGGAAGETIQSQFIDESTNVEKGLLYFGCGTQNIANSGLDINAFGFITKYYSIQSFMEGTGDSPDTPTSKLHMFEIVEDDCAGYETIRLAFLNSLGAYDYYNFTKKSTKSTAIKRSPFKQRYGTVANDDAFFYSQGTYEGGTRTFNVNAVQTIECNTDFINAQDCEILEELFISPSVFMQDGDDFVPVVILDTEYITQTDANDKLKQYILTIEKAHNTRVQRL
ncbi:MAG: hypothetical protein Unbinned92contig1003_12 [Prokaryotic dsDNA virus sp.]|nr:MAG: hypothetical protein Unbinned92contig1003_12 [Prokaryotic dsDNA virus sp.]|tara:strand:+ start:7845 stop:9317 length:1473 start_codon:yes stop_codon:yes gene_type:complete